MIYPSKKDWWLAALFLPVCLVMPVVGVFLICLALTQAGPAPVALPGLILLAVGFLTMWAFVSTSYEITSADLIVRHGPLRWQIPLEAITEIVPKKRLSTDRAWGVAWSLDRLIIRYRKRSGRRAFLGVAISPADKEGFLIELAEAVSASGSKTKLQG